MICFCYSEEGARLERIGVVISVFSGLGVFLSLSCRWGLRVWKVEILVMLFVYV